jgi:hypothetical protein
MTDLDSEVAAALLKDSKDALEAGKKGFGKDLPKVLFRVNHA